MSDLDSIWSKLQIAQEESSRAGESERAARKAVDYKVEGLVNWAKAFSIDLKSNAFRVGDHHALVVINTTPLEYRVYAILDTE
jgi:hypothetical protein